MNKTKQAGGNGWRNEISRCMDCNVAHLIGVMIWIINV
jgi:hypothetical protein